MKSKKEIMGIAALMVLMFHFYIPFGSSAFETYLFRSAFVGVDMFFFLSAYSLSSRNRDKKFEYGKFLLNRVISIYLPFVFLAVVAAIYKKWSFWTLAKVITGVEFFNRGGGAFLWYFVGIMILYLLSPVFIICVKKLRCWGALVLLGAWLVLAIVIQFVIKCPQIFILVNRLPVFILGLYYDDLIRNNLKKLKTVYVLIIELALFVAGTILVYKFATASRLNKPFTDMYYLIAIPLVVSIIMVTDTIVNKLEGKYKSKVLAFIGGITLEVYGLQMVFGYDIEMVLLKVMPAKQLAFVGTALVLILMAFIFNLLIRQVRKIFSKKGEEK